MTETWRWSWDARARLSANSCLTARKIKALEGDFMAPEYCFVYKMVYCSVACCTNGNHNWQDLSYFVFLFDARLKKWIKFCRRADTKFAIEATKGKAGKPNNLRICSAHFVLESYKRTLNGRRKILESALPTIFKPSEKRSPRLRCSLRIREKETPAERRYQNTWAWPSCGHQ